MDNIYDAIINRKSVRAFKDDEIPDNIVKTIVEAGQRAPTTGNSQAYSVIWVKDAEMKQRLGKDMQVQSFVYNAPVWLFVCADWHRQTSLYKSLDINIMMNKVSKFLVGSIDSTLFTQNMVIAAEGLGIGSILIGSVWCNIDSICDNLKLPNDVMPIMLMCMGYAKSVPKDFTPRWPLETVLHYEKYNPVNEEQINQYYEAGNRRLVLMNYFDEGIDSWAKHYTMRVGNEGHGRTWKPLNDSILRRKYL